MHGPGNWAAWRSATAASSWCFGNELSFQGGQAALGALLVFGSAVSYAVYLVYSGQLVQRLGSLRLVGMATTVECLCDQQARKMADDVRIA